MNKEKKSANKAAKADKQPMTKSEKVSLAVGIVLCAILIPVLVMNCVMIITSYVKDKPPAMFGYTPLVVNSGSMEPLFYVDDVILAKDIDPNDIKEGDVISYFEKGNNGRYIVTHRVLEVYEEDGQKYAVTAGDWNVMNDYKAALNSCKTDEEKAEIEAKAEELTDENREGYTYVVYESSKDKNPVTLDEQTIIGVYSYSNAPKWIVGAMNFMQSVWGWIIFVIIPVIALIAFEILSRMKKDKQKSNDMDALLAELEALKAQKAAEEAASKPSEAENNTQPDAEDASKDE